MTHRPRFDERSGVYRDCRWCAGGGCLQCEAERDAEYARQFPNGPQPIFTARLDDPASVEALKQFLIEAGMHPVSAAQGTEAGTAETEGLGPKDDGPVPEGNAPISPRQNISDVLIEALTKAAVWFEEYAFQHGCKATQTADDAERVSRLGKSKRNKERAEYLRDALRQAKGGEG